MSAASPLPWVVRNGVVACSKGYVVARVSGHKTSEGRANEALIDRAVNSHAALVASVQDLLLWLDDGYRVLSDACAADVAKARAALKKIGATS